MQIFCHGVIRCHEGIASLIGFICKTEDPRDLCLEFIAFFRVIGEVVMRRIGEHMKKIPHLEREIQRRDEVFVSVAFVEFRD